MKVEIDVEELKKNNITPNQYFILFSIHNKKDLGFQYEPSEEELKFLLSNNFIKIIPNLSGKINIRDSFLTEKGSDLFPNRAENEIITEKNELKVSDWIEDWRGLWPSGVRTGNHLVKGDRKTCHDKMQKFMKDYPEYEVDVIFDATQNYIEKCSLNGYKFMKVSHHFITKRDAGSTLAAECEAMISTEPSNQTRQDYGQQAL